MPSNATTNTGGFIRAGSFPTAQYCGHCHQAAYHQWRQSLHANSFREPFYLKNVRLLNSTQGIVYSRHCEGCHDPIALFSGALTSDPLVKKRSFDADGITCSVCHSISKLQPSYGTGSYVMGTPAVIVDEAGNPIPGEVPYSQVLLHVDRHVRAVMKDFYKTPEYCGACHKAALPRELNQYKWLPAINLYDEWQASAYSHRSPLPFYVKTARGCQSCHMPTEPVRLKDDGAKNGMLASHRWVAGNTAVPFFYGYEEQLQKTIAFLRDQRLNVDLFALRVNGERDFTAPLGSTRFRLNPGDSVEADVVIQNKRIGHSLIPEQRDILEAWVAFSAADRDGRIIAQSGRIGADGTLDAGAHSFTTRMLPGTGNVLEKHEVWLRRTNATDITIASGRSTLVRYQFLIPSDVKGPVTITAKVRYRHFNGTFTNFVLGAKHKRYPIVDMAACSRILNIGENGPVSPVPEQNPEWMRWNNFGIALLDEQQYARAADAFSQVARLRPDYADVHTNLGIAYYQWEQYAKADAELKQALAISANNSRAMYYQALVDRTQGDLNGAVTNLKQVAAQYPLSADARRELGFSYYQLHQYRAAEEQYRALQAINPNDLSAHYILAIVYRRLGMKDKAAAESALFADEKNDPMANTTSLEFLAKHPELSGESVPWHVHRLGAGAVVAAAEGGR